MNDIYFFWNWLRKEHRTSKVLSPMDGCAGVPEQLPRIQKYALRCDGGEDGRWSSNWPKTISTSAISEMEERLERLLLSDPKSSLATESAP